MRLRRGSIEERAGVNERGYYPPAPEPEIEPHDDESPVYNVSQMGFALVCVGAIGMAVAAFLPYAETTGFQRIAENTLIQQQGGWALLIFALGAFGSAYRKYSLGRPGWAPSVWGLLALGIAIWIGTDKSLRTLYPVGSNGEANTSLPGTVAGVGIGVYVAGAAGAITAWGGVQMAKARIAAPAPVAVDEPTMRCPECAETVLAAARVCKHCGHRFADAAPA